MASEASDSARHKRQRTPELEGQSQRSFRAPRHQQDNFPRDFNRFPRYDFNVKPTLVDPYDLPHLMNIGYLSEFLLQQRRDDIVADPDRMIAAYERYKLDFLKRQNYAFFLHHRRECWFQEKYCLDSEHKQMRNKQRLEGWKGRPEAFLALLEEGKWDSISYDEGPDEVAASASFSHPEVTSSASNPAVAAHLKKEERLIVSTKNQIIIKTLPTNLGRIKMENALREIPGIKWILFFEPTPAKNFLRTALIQCEDDVNINDLLAGELSNLIIDGFKVHLAPHYDTCKATVNYISVTAGLPPRIQKDIVQAKDLIQKLELNYSAITGVDGINFDVEAKANLEEETSALMSHLHGVEKIQAHFDKVFSGMEDAVAKDKKLLDLLIVYLQEGFNTSYYAAGVFDHAEERIRKAYKYLRRTSLISGSDDASEDWQRALDSKIAYLINPKDIDVKAHGGMSYEEDLSDLLVPLVKDEEETKFRCLPCSKLFKAPTFVEKHIANKHPEIIAASHLPNIHEFNFYVFDSMRIVPLTTFPASINYAPPLFMEHLPAFVPSPQINMREKASLPRRVPSINNAPANLSFDPRSKQERPSYTDLDAVATSTIDLDELPY